MFSGTGRLSQGVDAYEKEGEAQEESGAQLVPIQMGRLSRPALLHRLRNEA